MVTNELNSKIIETVIEVHNGLGPRVVESAQEKDTCCEIAFSMICYYAEAFVSSKKGETR